MLTAQGAINQMQQIAAWVDYQSKAENWASQNLPADYAKFKIVDFTKFQGTGDLGSSTLSARE